MLGQERAHLSMSSRLSEAESLLGNLRDKIEKATFETKRQLVMSLVDKVTVDTVEESGRRAVRIKIEYCFSNPGDRPPDRHHGGDSPGGDGNDIAYCVTSALSRATALLLPKGPSTIGPRRRRRESLLRGFPQGLGPHGQYP